MKDAIAGVLNNLLMVTCGVFLALAFLSPLACKLINL